MDSGGVFDETIVSPRAYRLLVEYAAEIEWEGGLDELLESLIIVGIETAEEQCELVDESSLEVP